MALALCRWSLRRFRFEWLPRENSVAHAAGSMENGSPGGTSAAELHFAEIMATRLCHDMAGMLGTVLGALELSDSDPSMRAEALPVAYDGARQLASRLRMLRVAWGGADSAENQGERSVGLDAFLDLATGLPQSRRVKVRLDGLEAGRHFTPSAVRVLLNILMLGFESLHGAGVLSMSGGRDGGVVVVIEGPRAAWPAGLVAMLANPAAALAQATALDGHRHMLATFTALIARRAGIDVTMLMGAVAEQAPPLLIDLV
jgi:histidine phosphotransferase ChpT